ncbi:hypothetical protein GF407_13030 [candidate division KSB1 bacterium]|nr:hypothetical protein [candidate division KSB1 bacterium]
MIRRIFQPCRNVYYILRYLGFAFVRIRLKILVQKKTGKTRRRFQFQSWDRILLSDILKPGVPVSNAQYGDYKLADPPSFFFPLNAPPNSSIFFKNTSKLRHPLLEIRLSALRQKNCLYFFHKFHTVSNWHYNPIDGKYADGDNVWSDIPDYRPEQGDPRMLWEPSRAAWALDLARGRAAAMLSDAGTLYWQWLDSWLENNPPFYGFQWKCGQESAVRFLALAIGFWSTGAERAREQSWFLFARLAWATGYRIRHHIEYAVSQKNNHSISEACGLILIAHLFPEFRKSGDWRSCGRRVLQKELKRQIYDDGSYVQHSMNYQRVMLQGALLALRIAEIEGEPFPRELYDKIETCSAFLFQMMDSESGRVPQYGPNDGAWIFPMNECEFWDFRPLVQAVHYLVHRKRLFPHGPWDEDLVWLYGESALHAPLEKVERKSSRFDTGGYYTLRDRDSWIMMRCHAYRDRPAHSDPLHVDLWYKGINVLRDCGTYKYYNPDQPQFEHYFDSIYAHNSVLIDRKEPMDKVSRFMKFPWPKANLLDYKAGKGYTCLSGTFLGYHRRPWRVRWRRTVINIALNQWIIVDDLYGKGEHDIDLFWHLNDLPVKEGDEKHSFIIDLGAEFAFIQLLTLNAEMKTGIVRGKTDHPVQGWISDYYSEKKPAPVIIAQGRGELPCRILGMIRFNDDSVLSGNVQDNDTVELYINSRPLVVLNTLENIENTVIYDIGKKQTKGKA